MALAEFWNNVWERNPLARGNLQAPDVPRVTAAELKKVDAAWMLGREHWNGGSPKSWTDVAAVAGYDPADFDFLPDADRERLTALVAEYHAAATELASADRTRAPIPLSESRRGELRGQAGDALQQIILLLEQDRYRDPDALRFGKLVEQQFRGHLPDGVAELRFLAGEDSAGEPAIWVWAFLSDEATATDELLVKTGRMVRPILRAAARTAAPNHYPYILFRGISERVEEGAAA